MTVEQPGTFPREQLSAITSSHGTEITRYDDPFNEQLISCTANQESLLTNHGNHFNGSERSRGMFQKYILHGFTVNYLQSSFPECISLIGALSFHTKKNC